MYPCDRPPCVAAHTRRTCGTSLCTPPATTYSRDLVDGKHVGGTDDPLKFIVGRGEVVPGFDAAVLSMAKVGVYAGVRPPWHTH